MTFDPIERQRQITRSEEARLYALADRVTLQHALYNRIEIEWMVDPWGGYLMLKIYASVPDRRAPSRTDGHDVGEIPTTTDARISASLLLDLPEGEALGYIVQAAHEFIRNALIHELDEMLLCDGKRVHDPHPNADGEGWLDGLLAVMRDDGMQTKLREGYRRDRLARLEARNERRRNR